MKMNRPTRTLILIMSVLVVVVIVLAQSYYRRQNRMIDPRIEPARRLYASYNQLTEYGTSDSIFRLLDSIEAIYTSVEHYKSSYELGVLSNNRAALWLTRALHDHTCDSICKDSLIAKAAEAVQNSISIYQQWGNRFGDTDADADVRRQLMHNEFLSGLEAYTSEQQEQFLDMRIEEIQDSKGEITRRLSVSYTNLGITHRYHLRYDSAAVCYTKALELWDRNLTAENNLNQLLGRPARKPNVIQRLFPPQR